MAMLLVEGFDSYQDNDEFVKGRWSAFSVPGLSANMSHCGLNLTGSNFTGPCLDSTSSMVLTAKLNQASHSTNEVFIGFWFKYNGTYAGTNKWLVLSEDRDNIDSTATNALTCAIGVTPTNNYITIKQWYDTNTSYDYTGTTDINDNTWHWFEARLQWDQTTGDVETYIDGTADITVNLADTISAASPPTFTGWRYVTIHGTSTASTSWDDLIIYDVESTPTGTPTSGSFPLGESKIETLRPTGAGTNSDWSNWGLSLAGNYDAVNKTSTQFDNYEHIWSNTNLDDDSYAFGNLSNSPTEIHTLVIDQYIRKTGNSTVYCKGLAYSGSTTGVTSSRVVPGLAFRIQQHEMPYDPNTTALWTGSGVDAAEFGIRYSTS